LFTATTDSISTNQGTVKSGRLSKFLNLETGKLFSCVS
jgi:hypothetical protein